jgi:hypothetical protein
MRKYIKKKVKNKMNLIQKLDDLESRHPIILPVVLISGAVVGLLTCMSLFPVTNVPTVKHNITVNNQEETSEMIHETKNYKIVDHIITIPVEDFRKLLNIPEGVNTITIHDGTSFSVMFVNLPDYITDPKERELRSKLKITFQSKEQT